MFTIFPGTMMIFFGGAVPTYFATSAFARAVC